MNDRKRAWQLVYNAVRQRGGTGTDDVTWRAQLRAAVDEADNTLDLVNNLATFGAMLAFAGGGDRVQVLSTVQALDDSVMSEDDDGPPSI